MKALFEVVGSRPETLMRFYQHVSRTATARTAKQGRDQKGGPPAPPRLALIPSPVVRLAKRIRLGLQNRSKNSKGLEVMITSNPLISLGRHGEI